MSNRFSPHWTFGAFRAGVIATLPLMPGMFAFGIAFGTVAARKGFSLFEAEVMSAVVFAGVAQLVVVEAWPQELTAATIFAAAAVTFIICSRFLLIGASMRPVLVNLPAVQVYPFLHFVIEPPWLLTLRYQREGGDDPGFIFGSAATCWVVWVASTAPGFWLGASVDPQRFGLDMVMPAFFTAMMVSLWQGRHHALGWIVAGLTAIVSEQLLGGFWYVFTGALAGSLVGGLSDE